jgi:hypothetical protein
MKKIRKATTTDKIIAFVIVLLAIAFFGIEAAETGDEDFDKVFIHEINEVPFVCMSEETFTEVLEVFDERDAFKASNKELSSALKDQEHAYMEVISAYELELQEAQRRNYWKGFGTGAAIVGGVLVTLAGGLVLIVALK